MAKIFFIDTEYNETGGDLLSMALVDVEGDEFYEVIERPGIVLTDWVKAHVEPVFQRIPITYTDFQDKLFTFLSPYSVTGFTVMADHPADLKYFCESLVVFGGVTFNFDSFNLICHAELGNYKSEIPHNALADAEAIKNCWLQIKGDLRYKR